MENEDFLTRQLVTYIGNKRALLDFIGDGLSIVKDRLSKNKLVLFDVFSGSGVVSRYFKRFAGKLIVNDIERYAELISTCYLANSVDLDIAKLKACHRDLVAKIEDRPLGRGFIRELYAPVKDDDIQAGERVFYTSRNADYLDNACRYISELEPAARPFFLGPLLSEASVHTNTSGVFKGFHKNPRTGNGQFGGRNKDALVRIMGDIRLPFPVFSSFTCETEIYRGDANRIIETVGEVDLAYIDPPYNQHPYGSNYFMLNLIADYSRPDRISPVSGIPENWNRSAYNKSRKAYDALASLVENIKAKFLLISFNSEGFIGPDDMKSMLSRVGKVQVLETRYNTFRGSRNLNGRGIHLKEYLYLVEKN